MAARSLFSGRGLRAVLLVSGLATFDATARENSPFRPAFRSKIHADAPSLPSSDKQRLLIVGGGSGGLGVATQLPSLLKSESAKIEYVIVEPSDVHFYQPGWTLVGTGITDIQSTARAMSSVMPKHVKWIQKAVSSFDPDSNTVTTEDGQKIAYDYLVVASGLQADVGQVKGLQEALEDPNSPVATIYDYRYAPKAFELVKNMNSGKALFAMVSGPVKCGGAPVKMLLLSEDFWRSKNIREKISVEYLPAMGSMFGVKKYSDELEKLRVDRRILGSFGHDLVAVDKDAREATFKVVATGELVKKSYEFLHTSLPFKSPDFVSSSPLADKATGFVEVDKETLRHTRYGNVFAIGDSANLPTSKTIAAITAQAPVLAHNLSLLVRAKAHGLPEPPLTAKYDGYTSCPLLTSHGTLMLAEFKYGGVPAETFGHVVNQGLPRWIFFKMKTDFFPRVYWGPYMSGHWYGSKGFFRPKFDDPIPVMMKEKKSAVARA